MAEDSIVAGLFGLSPYQVQQQRQVQIGSNANQYAQLEPFQQANQMLYKGGAGLGQVGAGMMGMQDPAVVEAQQRQAVMQGADTSTPEGLKALAEKLQAAGMQKEAMLAMERARTIETQNIKNSNEQAQADLYKAQAVKALTEKQIGEGGARPTVARLLDERSKYPVGSEQYNSLTDAIKKETYIKPEKSAEYGMKPGDELRWMNQHSKDSQAAMATIDTSTDAATKVMDIKNDPKFGYIFGGYTEKALSKLAPGEIAGLQSNVDSLKSTLMVAGLNTMRAGGGVGAITEKEWPIFEKLVASLDQKMDEKTATKRLDEIYSYFDRAKSRASETYQKKWSNKQDFYDPEIIQRAKMPIVAPTRTKPPQATSGGGWAIRPK